MARRDYTRHKKYKLEEVLPLLGDQNIQFDEHFVYVGGKRQLLWLRETTCNCCGLQANHLWLERNSGKYHFNLYGINDAGEEVMLTQDHIVPKSKGGESTEANLQLLCAICNSVKSSHDLTMERLKVKVDAYYAARAEKRRLEALEEARRVESKRVKHLRRSERWNHQRVKRSLTKAYAGLILWDMRYRTVEAREKFSFVFFG